MSDREIDKFLHRKREAKRLHRLQQLKGQNDDKDDKDLPRTSYPLRALDRNSTRRRKPSKNRKVTLKIPPIFSVLEKPELVVSTVYKLAEYHLDHPKLSEMYFDHSEMSDFDLAAEQILDHVTSEIKRMRRRKKSSLKMSGAFPSDHRASRFIRGVGIIHALGLTERYLSKKERDAMEIFSLADNRALKKLRRSSQLTPRDNAVKKFADHVNNCLGREGYRLTGEGLQSLGIVVGEVIDNSNEHSNGDDWVISGYLDTTTDEHICEIAVFNFGMSIAQSLQSLPEDHYTRLIIQPYLAAHERKGFFSRGWTEEDLLTLVALQENVSSKNESDQDTRGGGTVDLLEFFKKIYDEAGKGCETNLKMAILSGRTHIMFDGTYSIAHDRSNRKIIALNAENRLDILPDGDNIKHLEGNPFPGTEISIKFPLQNSQFEKQTGDEL